MSEKKKSIRESLKIIENLDKRLRDIAKRILEEKGIILAELSEDQRKEREAVLRQLEEERKELLRQRDDYMEGVTLDLDQIQMDRRDLLRELTAEIEYETLSIDMMLQAELLMGKKWDEMTLEEKIRALLQLRGLRLTPSGRIQTLSGRFLTLAEVAAMFEGIDLEAMLKELLAEEEKEQKSEDICPIESSIKTESTTSLKASSESSHSSRESVLAGLTSEDVHYLKQTVGRPLIMAIAEITAKQPSDPIHYLGNWLFKYRLNEENDVIQRKELEELIMERERLMKEKLTKMFEEEARACILDAIVRAEERAIQNQIEAELRRIAMETAMLEEEGEGLYDEARDVLGVYNGPPAGQSLL
ncbi:uncharacterized protein LOC108742748 isoform X2 [Agrilus planipennis]|nr:uncharacterized protein LOC108742748 isoform X2 [Agrilus planipennis]